MCGSHMYVRLWYVSVIAEPYVCYRSYLFDSLVCPHYASLCGVVGGREREGARVRPRLIVRRPFDPSNHFHPAEPQAPRASARRH